MIILLILQSNSLVSRPEIPAAHRQQRITRARREHPSWDLVRPFLEVEGVGLSNCALDKILHQLRNHMAWNLRGTRWLELYLDFVEARNTRPSAQGVCEVEDQTVYRAQRLPLPRERTWSGNRVSFESPQTVSVESRSQTPS